MKTVNRCVVTIKAKKPFLQWLKSLPDPADMTSAQVNQDSTVYLLPEYGHDDEQQIILERYFGLIFEEELAAWWQDEDTWPSQRDLRTFLNWFDVKFHSMVFDLVDQPLLPEE
ncbi:MAG: hypothetical protein ACYSWQ_06645 [Planctomycetota bacterium]|jgi:hypothetical protein